LPKNGITEELIHMGNCKGCNSAKTTKKLEEFQVARLPIHHILLALVSRAFAGANTPSKS
jgi:hypothetical protein